jgi:hypothetical protein
MESERLTVAGVRGNRLDRRPLGLRVLDEHAVTRLPAAPQSPPAEANAAGPAGSTSRRKRLATGLSRSSWTATDDPLRPGIP